MIELHVYGNKTSGTRYFEEEATERLDGNLEVDDC